MQLIEPLTGFKVTSGYMLMQIAFAIQAVYFLIRYDNLDTVYKTMLEVIIVFFGICFAAQYTSYLFSKSQLESKQLMIQACNFLYILSSTAGIYYVLTQQDELFASQESQILKVYESSDFIDNNSYKSDQEIMDIYYFFVFIIINYFCTVVFAFLFLLCSSCCSFKKKVPLQEELSIDHKNIQTPILQINELNDDFKKIQLSTYETDLNIECKDYLETMLPDIQQCFYKYGLMSVLAIYGYSLTDENASNYLYNRNYYYLAQSLLLLVLFIYHTVDMFSQKKFGKALVISKYLVQFVLFGLSVYLYMQTFVVGSATYGRSWAQLYFFIQVLDLLLSSYKYITSRREGKNTKIFQSLGEFTKETVSFHQHLDVEMSDDVYCICFLSYYFLIKKRQIDRLEVVDEPQFEDAVQEEAKEAMAKDIDDIRSRKVPISDILASQYFGKCLIVFTIQVLMVYFVMITFNEKGSGMKSANSFEILMIRLLCAIFLHIQVFDEIQQGIKMFYYAKNQIYVPSMRTAMILTSLMKICSSLFTEICNILLISSEDKTLDIIKDFVALTIIAELDSIYAMTLKNSSIRDRINGKTLHYDKSQEEKSNTGMGFRIWTGLYNIIHKIYVSFFYYFMPFLIPFISYYTLFSTIAEVSTAINDLTTSNSTVTATQ